MIMPTKKNESSKEPKKAPLAIEKEEKKAAPARSRKKAEPKPEMQPSR